MLLPAAHGQYASTAAAALAAKTALRGTFHAAARLQPYKLQFMHLPLRCCHRSYYPPASEANPDNLLQGCACAFCSAHRVGSCGGRCAGLPVSGSSRAQLPGRTLRARDSGLDTCGKAGGEAPAGLLLGNARPCPASWWDGQEVAGGAWQRPSRADHGRSQAGQATAASVVADGMAAQRAHGLGRAGDGAVDRRRGRARGCGVLVVSCTGEEPAGSANASRPVHTLALTPARYDLRSPRTYDPPHTSHAHQKHHAACCTRSLASWQPPTPGRSPLPPSPL